MLAMYSPTIGFATVIVPVVDFCVELFGSSPSPPKDSWLVLAREGCCRCIREPNVGNRMWK